MLATEPKLLHFDIPDADEPSTRRRVACYEWGDPQFPTVLCAHGLTRNGRDFDYLARSLARDYHVLCPDMPGRGHSGWLKNTQGYNNPSYVSDIGFMLHSLHINKVHWIGTSMGGIMGMMAVSSMPGVLQSLTHNDIGCLIPAEGLERIRGLADLKVSYPTRKQAEEAYRQRCANFGITNEAHWQHLFAHGLREHAGGVTGFTYDPAIFAAGLSADAEITDIDLWPLWEPIKAIPVLLIRGAESDLLTKQIAAKMQSRHPDLTLHKVANTGHAPTLMENKEIALIHEWLNSKG